jgi:hypothetical protein
VAEWLFNAAELAELVPGRAQLWARHDFARLRFGLSLNVPFATCTTSRPSVARCFHC